VLPLSIPPIGPQPMTADIRRHDGHAERLEGVAVDRVVSRLSFGHHWPRCVTGRPMPAAASAGMREGTSLNWHPSLARPHAEYPVA
jgi:hypothetical protein